MSLELNIERLILHDVPRHHRQRIAAAFERELARLVAEQGLPAAAGGEIQLDGLSLQVDKGLRPEQIGSQIAQQVYQQFGE